jgi:peptidyl-dipeptidase Dcp
MAENPEQVIDLLTDLTIKANPKALLEIDEIKEYFSLTEINSWDMPYYSRILKEKKYRLDDKKLKEYFEFTSVQKWLFETVEKLYDIKMKKLDNNDLSENGSDIKYNENIEIYEVYKWDKFISYFMWDYFYNPNKRSWAWADEVRERFWNKKSIVINNMSFVKAENWKTLLTLWEVETMFHEFGHGIHSMLSKSKYADLTWVQVEWDFVELPSQLLENWSNNPETIINIASHYETWEKIPWELVDSLERLKYFWTWNFVLGQSIYSIMDMYFHSGVVFKDVSELDKIFLEKVNELSIFKKDKNYKMYCSFSHIFDWWYSAGYYSYTWADIIVSEILAVFKESWMYDKETATRFEKLILWAWSVKKASDMFKDFMWREISIEAFLKEKW